MTLYETIQTLNYYASKQPAINAVIESGDIYDISKENYEMKFGTFCVQQEPEYQCDGNQWTFNFILYYVDRLTQDKSNRLEIQSVGIETINAIVNKVTSLSMINVDWSSNINVFTERFTEECAGAYIRLRLSTPVNSICKEVIQRLGEFAPFEFSDAFFKFIETI